MPTFSLRPLNLCSEVENEEQKDGTKIKKYSSLTLVDELTPKNNGFYTPKNENIGNATEFQFLKVSKFLVK